MNNKLGDLNNYLFAEMERLNDEEMDDAQLEREIRRAQAIGKVAQAITCNANVVLRTVELQAQVRGTQVSTPGMLEG